MKLFSSCALVLAAMASAASANPDERVYDDMDAVVIEGDSDVADLRSGRQLFPSLGYPAMTLPLQQLQPRTNVSAIEQPCLSKKGQMGRCTTVKECYPYFKLFNFEKEDTWVFGSYDTCTYNHPEGREITGVCCVEPDLEADLEEARKYEEQRKANVEEEEFPIEAAVNENCGKRYFRAGEDIVPTLYQNPYIVNGEYARTHEYPFMAALLNNGRQFCGGALVDEKHILTAAHCVSHMSKRDVQNLIVRLGDHNLRGTGETNVPAQDYRVKRVIRHKKFKTSTLHNDVAVLTLDRAVVTGNTIQPICLEQDRSKDFAGRYVTVAGWGTTSDGGSTSPTLRKVDVRVWTNSKCSSSYGSNAPGGIMPHMICASTPEQRKDSCSGDSGGPLFICEDRCYQIGIVSWGIGCARQQYPGVYTRVTELLPWIKKIVNKY